MYVTKDNCIYIHTPCMNIYPILHEFVHIYMYVRMCVYTYTHTYILLPIRSGRNRELVTFMYTQISISHISLHGSLFKNLEINS